MLHLSTKKQENRRQWDVQLFFLITFGWSWFWWFLEILLETSLFVGPFGPFVAAFLLTELREGKEGVISLLKKGVSCNFPKGYWIPVFFLFPAISAIAFLIGTVLGESFPPLIWPHQPLIILRWFVSMLFLGGPLQEEFGWRGYALTRLEKRHNALVSSIILGLIWSFWHLPLFFMDDMTIQYQLQNFFSSLPLFIFVSILFTWIYHNSGGSVLAVLLFHTMLNLSSYQIFPVLSSQISGLFYYLLIVAAAIIVVKIYGSHTLVRTQNR